VNLRHRAGYIVKVDDRRPLEALTARQPVPQPAIIRATKRACERGV
jgi:hypothetical protein